MSRIKDYFEYIRYWTIGHLKCILAFGNAGKRSWIVHPLRIKCAKNQVTIGDNVTILNNLRLEVLNTNSSLNPQIKIDNNVNIEQNVHITCGESILIGEECTICGGVAITDIIHPYEDINIKPDNQKIITRPVEIGRQSFIGMHAFIMPGVKIGTHCVIGANSVVTVDVPDYSIYGGGAC